MIIIFNNKNSNNNNNNTNSKGCGVIEWSGIWGLRLRLSWKYKGPLRGLDGLYFDNTQRSSPKPSQLPVSVSQDIVVRILNYSGRLQTMSACPKPHKTQSSEP